MTLTNFRIVAVMLIIFSLIGTIVTWTAHLVKPGTPNTEAILSGTEFTAPLVFIASWMVFVLMTRIRGMVGTVGMVLMTLAALVFAIGETTELFKSNIGLNSAKWTFVLAASVVGLAIAVITVVLGIGYLVKSRKR